MLGAQSSFSFRLALLSGLPASLGGFDSPELVNIHICGSGAEEGSGQAAAGVM